MSPRRARGSRPPADPQDKRAQPESIADRADMRQVADRAGVAMSSVSRVLSGHPDVSEAMRRRVTAAVEELGYEPNMLAGMLRRGATRTIGFVIGDISNPLMAQIALGAEVTLTEAGYTMVLVNSLGEAHLDASYIRLLQQRRVDGLLLSVTDETSEDTVSSLARAAIPAVLIDRDLPALPDTSAVLSDHAAGITAAMEHLIQLGHRRIGLVAGSPHVRPTRERIAAAEDAAEAHPGVLCQVRPGAFTQEHGAAATQELLARGRPPTAIIAGGNQILVGVLRSLRDRQLRIPRDVSLVTCDEVPLAEFLTPPLATIRRDPYQMGVTAAGLLLDRFGGAGRRVAELPTQFVTADSCAKPRPLHDTSSSRSSA
ncbi:MAG TPA: LacI family DNA-binding transcriptional regulator [Trebonia sp.]|jgi:LacI family transcriptional regulator|nr:LacI family DNA-binding transcriptional regulator [Trebonia sp.]